jgi:outer membrane biogenesis lipoprotein LolB
MKRLVGICVLSCVSFFLAGCGHSNDEVTKTSAQEQLRQVTNRTHIDYDDVGRVVKSGDVDYEYDDNGNLLRISSK